MRTFTNADRARLARDLDLATIARIERSIRVCDHIAHAGLAIIVIACIFALALI